MASKLNGNGQEEDLKKNHNNCMAKAESKTRQILAFLSRHRGETFETQELVELFSASSWTVVRAVEMNPSACRAINFKTTIEVFDEDADLRSSTSDVRDTRHRTEREVNSSRGTRSWQGRKTLRKLNGEK